VGSLGGARVAASTSGALRTRDPDGDSEEYAGGFPHELVDLFNSPRPWSERAFLLTFVFVFGARWCLAAAAALYQIRVANYMLWFYALGAGLLNAISHFVFPIIRAHAAEGASPMVSGPLAGRHPIVSRERASLGGGRPIVHGRPECRSPFRDEAFLSGTTHARRMVLG
jgi:hypothetical protein